MLVHKISSSISEVILLVKYYKSCKNSSKCFNNIAAKKFET